MTPAIADTIVHWRRNSVTALDVLESLTGMRWRPTRGYDHWAVVAAILMERGA